MTYTEIIVYFNLTIQTQILMTSDLINFIDDIFYHLSYSIIFSWKNDGRTQKII